QHPRGQAGKFTTKPKPGAGVSLAAEDDSPQAVYTNRDDAIQREISEALPAGESDSFDTDAIADEVLDWHSSINTDGSENLDHSGYAMTAGPEEFWEAVARHDLDRPKEDRSFDHYVASLSPDDQDLARRMVAPLGPDTSEE